MAERRIGAAPVISGDGLVGILTRSDLLRALLSLGAPGGTPQAS